MLDLLCIDRWMYWEGSALVECTILEGICFWQEELYWEGCFRVAGAVLGGICFGQEVLLEGEDSFG
jgi:hypothetical protein